MALKELITVEVSPSHLYEAVYKGKPAMAIVYNPGESNSANNALKKAYVQFLDDMLANRKKSSIIDVLGIESLSCFPACPDYPILIVERNDHLVNFFTSETSPVLSQKDQLSILLDIACAVCNFDESSTSLKRVEVLENSLFISRDKDSNNFVVRFCPIFGYSYLVKELEGYEMVASADLEWIKQITLLLCWGKDLTSEKEIPSGHILRAFIQQWFSDVRIESLHSIKSDLQMLLGEYINNKM